MTDAAKPKKKRAKKLCRPPKWLTVEVERLGPGGKWAKDNGQPGFAFSGKDDRGFPYAIYPTETKAEREAWGDDRIANVASRYTCDRFHCSNGYTVAAVRAKTKGGKKQ